MSSNPDFIPGLELSEAFYREAARPILDAHFPRLPHSAALLGWSSEVLGYDDAQSTDHSWGARFYLFLAEPDREQYEETVRRTLAANLPPEFRGYPTSFGRPDEGGVRHARQSDDGTIEHAIDCETVRSFFGWYLGCDPHAEITTVDWLTFSEHKLLGATSGKVFHDGLNELEAARRKFSYYPDDVWRFLLARQWGKLSENEAFVGRCGATGDELGSAVLAARQVGILMGLCFLMARRYAPYGKWFGRAFSGLPPAAEMTPALQATLAATDWKEREAHLSTAYETAARLHNALGITRPVPEKVSDYHGRGYLVIHADVIMAAIRDTIRSPDIFKLKHHVGSVNQFVDSTDLLSKVELCRTLKALYE
ncbi:MAG TPA: DUF4037 domain-containing protein [Pyrinomonadaceae bacterium]|nr:DUF4037 domain-containing protein [Pyrinomonadaceae bacterium]